MKCQDVNKVNFFRKKWYGGLGMKSLKQRFENLSLPKILKGIACILSSIYLTFYVDQYTLNTIWTRLFIFGCILIVCGIFLRVMCKVFKFAPSMKNVLLTIVTVVLILVGYRDVFFPTAQETYITLISETEGEICLCDVVVDGVNIPVAQVEVVDNLGWMYREQYDNFMIWPEEDGIKNQLTMRFRAEEVHLGFPFTPYAGSVTIRSSIGEDGTWDLRCPERSEGEPVEYADFPLDCRRTYSPLEILLYSAGIIPLVSFFCFPILCTLGLAWRKSLRIWAGFLRFLKKKWQNLNKMLRMVKSFLLSKLSYLRRFLLLKKKPLSKIKSCKVFMRRLLLTSFTMNTALDSVYGVFILALSCVVAFGDKISVYESPYFFPAKLEDFLQVAFCFVIFFIVGNIFLTVAKYFVLPLNSIPVKRRWWGAAFLLLVFLWMPYLLVYYPGILTPDSFTSLLQAKDISILYNHIPIAYTLMVASFTAIGWSVGDANFGVFLFSLSQYLTMAGVLSYLAYWVRMKMENKVVSWIVLLYFGLNPVVGLYSITMWKDVLFSAWIVLLCIFLSDTALEEGKKLGTKKGLMKLSILFMLVSFGRNNGIYVVVICWLTLLILFRIIRKKMLIAGGVTILVILLVQGPVYTALGIDQAGFAESVGIPIQQISYTVINDQPLCEEDAVFLEKIIPLKTIKENYSPVSADNIKFNSEFNTAFFEENKKEFVKLYFRLLPEHLGSYVRAYLLSTSGFWKIENINWIVAEDIHKNDMGIYNVDYLNQFFHIDLKKDISNLLTLLGRSPITNVGIMVWLVFFYVIVCFKQKQSWKAFLVLPLICCWITLMVATPVFTQFRYVYFYHLMLPIVCCMFFVKRENVS